jgi:hypothetical protein
MRSLFLAVALLLGARANVAATPLLTFSDGSLSTGALAFLSDTSVNWAAAWTQSAASGDVRLSAILSSNVGPTSAQWFVTTGIGPGTTAADVVYSGTYVPTPPVNAFDFNGATRTILGSGLAFTPGTYYLVLDGPPGGLANNANWTGDFTGVTAMLAPGFSLGSYYSTVTPASFAPSSSFSVFAGPSQFVFELESVPQDAVPEPGTLSLLALGLLTAGWRRRRQ